MGIEEDRIELTGSNYERMLHELKEGTVNQFLVWESNKWVFQKVKPPPGKEYIERMPDGKCRKWSNQNGNDDKYQPIQFSRDMEFLSTAIVFLLGTATGATGGYYAAKYTDQRREKEAKNHISSTFNSLWDKHHDLMLEMKNDLEGQGDTYQREFFILNSKWSFNHDGPYLSYHIDEHQNLEQRIRMLENHGFLIDVTEPGKNVSKYQFEEDFVSLLKGKKL